MQVTLNWTAVNNANSTGQEVQYKKITDAGWTTHATVGPAIETALITGLDDNVVYQFRIRNICAVGGPTGSGIDEDIKFTCPAVTITQNLYNMISYSFPHLGGSVSGYDVKLLAADGTSVVATNTHNAPGATVTGQFTGLNPSTTYQIRVEPKATGDLGTYSKTNCATTTATTPAAPTCGAPTNVTATIS